MKRTERTKAIEKALCTKHEGKMSGMVSLSTSPLENRHCVERIRKAREAGNLDNLICGHCFSVAYNEMRPALKNKLARNTDLLTAAVIPVEEMPVLNVAYFRLEAFGDINNEIQVENYFNLCRANKNTSFALWTKNPFYVSRVLTRGIKKPSNLIIIYSSPCLNHAVSIDRIKAVFPFIDKVFTVYDKEHADKSVKVNCGANHCMSCLKCYKKRSAAVINEKLK